MCDHHFHSVVLLILDTLKKTHTLCCHFYELKYISASKLIGFSNGREHVETHETTPHTVTHFLRRICVGLLVITHQNLIQNCYNLMQGHNEWVKRCKKNKKYILHRYFIFILISITCACTYAVFQYGAAFFFSFLQFMKFVYTRMYTKLYETKRCSYFCVYMNDCMNMNGIYYTRNVLTVIVYLNAFMQNAMIRKLCV